MVDTYYLDECISAMESAKEQLQEDDIESGVRLWIDRMSDFILDDVFSDELMKRMDAKLNDLYALCDEGFSDEWMERVKMTDAERVEYDVATKEVKERENQRIRERQAIYYKNRPPHVQCGDPYNANIRVD